MSSEPKTSDAYIALGANLGDRAANIRAALTNLGHVLDVRVIRASALMDNPAIGCPADSPPFLNAVAQLQTKLSPHQLLDCLLAIEAHMGRQRRLQWEPRIIDLDLLLYDQLVINELGLVLPHPRLHQRRFVLQPLAELAPNLHHPTLAKTIQTLLDELPPST